jgi:hypothetical protein
MTATSSLRVRDVACFIRSKNAGPFMLTIDLFFVDDAQCEAILAAGTLSPAVVAIVYGVAQEDVRVMHLAQACALKITFPRPAPAGEIGERDVAGGQQFTPLLDLPIDAPPGSVLNRVENRG